MSDLQAFAVDRRLRVEELKTLVNEFATSARLPSGEHTPEDLNAVVEETMLLFKEGHRNIRFSFDPDPALPLLALDREDIKRAVINMLDNAVAALTPPNAVEPRIDVRARRHAIATSRHRAGGGCIRRGQPLDMPAIVSYFLRLHATRILTTRSRRRGHVGAERAGRPAAL